MTEEVNAYAEFAGGVCGSENGGADLGCLLRDIFLSGSEFDYREWEGRQEYLLSDIEQRINRSIRI